MKVERVGSVMTAEIGEISTAQVVQVRPGDILALISEEAISDAAVARIRANLKPCIPEGVQVVVLDRMHFEVLRAEGQEQS